MLEPALRLRCAAFLADTSSATLQGVLDHLETVRSEFQAGDTDDPSDPRWNSIMAYLQAVPPDVDPEARLVQDINTMKSLIARHGDRRLT